MTRPELTRYLAVRTGHGDLAWYHRKFKHEDAELNCSCGSEKDPEHLVRCRKTTSAYRIWPEPPSRQPDGPRAISYLHKIMKKAYGLPRFYQGH